MCIAYNFSHFAIYLLKFIKTRANLTKFCQKQKCTVFRHGVYYSQTVVGNVDGQRILFGKTISARTSRSKLRGLDRLLR